MPVLRLAYVTLFVLALIGVFVLWAEVGGQGHLDLMPWYWKLVLGPAAAFAAVKAASAAASEKQAWNGRTRKWTGALLLLLLVCGMATYYCHLYFETDDNPDDEGETPAMAAMHRVGGRGERLSPGHRAGI